MPHFYDSKIQSKDKRLNPHLPNLKKVELNFTKSDDVRSYRITSDKIQNILGFKFEFSIEDAVEELCENFENGNLTDTFNTKFQNIKVLKNKLEKKEFI